MDLLKSQIQGSKPLTDWADNIVQLHVSALNTELALFKITKIRSIHNDEGISTKNIPQGVWWNQKGDLFFHNRFTLTNWQSHFKASNNFDKEYEFVKELATYPQPFERTDALNVGSIQGIPIPTVDKWLAKLVKVMKWLNKESHGKYSINTEVID
jgi:hypothetical protein